MEIEGGEKLLYSKGILKDHSRLNFKFKTLYVKIFLDFPLSCNLLFQMLYAAGMDDVNVLFPGEWAIMRSLCSGTVQAACCAYGGRAHWKSQWLERKIWMWKRKKGKVGSKVWQTPCMSTCGLISRHEEE